MPITQNTQQSSASINLLSKTAMVLCALIPVLCFALLYTARGWSPLWLLLGGMAGLPSLLCVWRSLFYRWAMLANIGALFLLVLIASADLWRSLLTGQDTDLSTHLLVLILALILAASNQLLHLHSTSPSASPSLNELVEDTLKGPAIAIAFCIGLIFCDLLMTWLQIGEYPLFDVITPKLLDRGVIPPITLTLFFWGTLLLLGKWLLMAHALKHTDDEDSPLRVARQRAGKSVKKRDELFAIIWQQFEAFYSLPRYINWSIPIFGFIGTVLGISLATEGLSAILNNNSAEFSQLLASALSPLGIAFDTTLIALSLSVVLGLLQTLLYRWEERQLLLLEETLA